MLIKVTKELTKEIKALEGRVLEREEICKILSKYKYSDTNCTTPKNGDILLDYAKELRRKATKEEIIFTKLLIKWKIPYKFQVPLRVKGLGGGYILDIEVYSKTLGKKIDIEIDGGYHNSEEQRGKDVVRDDVLTKCGYIVIRMTNEEVMHNPYDVFFHKLQILGASDILNKITKSSKRK